MRLRGKVKAHSNSTERMGSKKTLYSSTLIIRIAKSNLVKAGLGLVLSPHRKRMEWLFERLSPWAPNLYVHERDVICQGFIGYFEQRQQLEERCRGAKSATTLSYRDMLFSALGKEKERPWLLNLQCRFKVDACTCYSC